jgi:hypothetical protein
MANPGNGFLGRVARELAALAASFVPFAALSGASVTIPAAPPAEGNAYR